MVASVVWNVFWRNILMAYPYYTFFLKAEWIFIFILLFFVSAHGKPQAINIVAAGAAAAERAATLKTNKYQIQIKKQLLIRAICMWGYVWAHWAVSSLNFLTVYPRKSTG